MKKTKLLVAELRMIADTLCSEYCRECLLEAAQRLEDTHKIATFFRNKAENTGGDDCGRARRRICLLPILFRTKQHGTAQESDNQMRRSKQG